MKHNEPWSIDAGHIYDSDGSIVAYDEGTLGIGIGDDVAISRGRRIVACVNACKGISTDRLEKMVPGTLANLLTLKGEKK